LGRREPSRAASNNDDLLRNQARSCITPDRLRHLPLGHVLLAHEDFSLALFNRPARQRTQGGRAQGFARPEAKTGVMPWTSHRIPDHEPFGERAAVVRTGSINRKKLCALAREQDCLIADMAGKHATVAKVISWDASSQVGTDGS